MLQLYDIDKNKIQGLKLYKDYCIESVLSSGDKTLSFLYPSKLANEIKEEYYIRTRTHEFVVKEISTNGEWNSIKARLNVDELEGKPWEHFDTTEQTIEQCLNLALAGTGWTVQVNNVTKKRTIRKTNCSSWDIIQQAKKTYLVEIEFDTINKIIKVAEKLGNDKGVYFMDSLNLRNLDIQSNSYDFYTRIIAIGKDDLKVTVENFQYSTKKKTLIWKDERYTDLPSLTEDAKAKLEEISKPYRSYGADVIDLANISNKYSILNYNIGDTITLISKEKGIKEKQRIVKIVEYPEEPHRNSCEIANSILSFADVQKEYQDTTDTVSNITSDNGTISEGAIKVAVEHLTIKKLDVGSLNTVEIRVGNLEATSATITQLKAVDASIVNLKATKADIGDLTASVGRIDILESNVGDIKTLVNGNLTSNNIQSLTLTSDKVTVANGFIKNAMIENLDVNKINAGAINTNKITLSSADGGLSIVGPTMQFKDKSNIVRLQLGQDTAGDFNFILRATDGTTTLIDGYGIKEKAIANDLIKSSMVAADAIGEKQINYSSLITGLNKDTNTQLIKATKVALDATGQSLEISFNSLKSNVDNLEIGGRNLLKDTAKIKGNTTGAVPCNWVFTNPQFLQGRTITISIDIDCVNISKGSQDRLGCEFSISYEDGTNGYYGVWHHVSEGVTFKGRKSKTFKVTDKPIKSFSAMGLYSNLCNGDRKIVEFPKIETGNKATDWTPAPEDTEQKIETNTTALNVQQGKIDSLISNTTITKDGQTIQLKDSYNSTVATVDSLNNTIGKHTSTIDTLTGQITGVDTKVNAVERDLSGVKTSVSNATTTANSALSKATEAKQTADGFLQRVSNIETNYATTSAMNSAITQSATGIKSEVSNTYSTKTELNTVSGKVTNVETRVNTVEQNTTATAITTTISSAINAGTSSISTTQFVMDKTGFTVKNGAIKIQNKAGTNVLAGDINGNLTMVGMITTFNDNMTKRQIELVKNDINFYDWETAENNISIGRVYTGKQVVNGLAISTPALTIKNTPVSYISICSDRSMLMHFDDYNKSTYSGNIPIWFYKNAIMGIGTSMYFNMPGNKGRIFGGTLDTVVVEVPTTKKDNGFIVQSDTGTPLINTRAGYDYIISLKDTYIDGNFAASGSKNSLQKTEHYGERLINAYETAEYFFGDIGSGKIINGECVVYIDDIFQECINTKHQYHIFTQVYNGSITKIERLENHFVVYGEEGTEFSWELKAKRIGYENNRLETPNDFDNRETYENMFTRHFEEFEAEKTTEKESIEGDMYTNDTMSGDILAHELDFKLDDFLLNKEEV